MECKDDNLTLISHPSPITAALSLSSAVVGISIITEEATASAETAVDRVTAGTQTPPDPPSLFLSSYTH